MDFSESQFTWFNRRLGNYIELRLDRVLCSANWLNSWPCCQYVVLPRTVSNHSPLVVNCYKQLHQGPKPFCFLTMWTKHEEFKTLVAKAWHSQNIFRCPIYVHSHKLKGVKLALKDWHRRTFGHVDNEVQCARNILSSIQETISSHGLTEQHFQDEIEANLKV